MDGQLTLIASFDFDFDFELRGVVGREGDPRGGGVEGMSFESLLR